MKKVIRRDAKTAFNEEVQSGLPSRAKVKKRSATQTIKVPQEFFQTVRNTVGFRRFWRAMGASSYRRRAATLRRRTGCGRLPRNTAAGTSARSDSQFIQEPHGLDRRRPGSRGCSVTL